jgi:hypothetical protein
MRGVVIDETRHIFTAPAHAVHDIEDSKMQQLRQQ